MAVPRALWTHAPLALLRHRAVLVAVFCAAFLVAAAAAADPLLRAGAESEALKGKLDELSPLSAALTVEAPERVVRDLPATDAGRRAAVLRLGRTLPWTTRPIMATTSSAEIGADVIAGARPLDVILMARTGASAHVLRLAGGGNGAWIAARVAKLAHRGPGERLPLFTFGGRRVSMPIGAVYLQLDQDLGNPYWVNFIARIRTVKPDAPPLPTFVLVSPAELYRLSTRAGGRSIGNTFEFPVDEEALNVSRAHRIVREFAAVRRRLLVDPAFARSLGCVPACSVTSSLEGEVVLARESVSALTPVIRLLSGFAAAIALGAASVAGVFGVRRRSAEARLSVVGGERRTAFAVRALLEAAAPVLAGGAAGLGGALLVVRGLAPSGTLDGGVIAQAAIFAAAAAACALCAVAAGAWAARGPTVERERHRSRLRRLLVWELAALAAALALFAVVDRGSGLARNGDVGAHPRLLTLCVPLFLAAGLGGLAVRSVRAPLRAAQARSSTVFLALRRLAAARSLLVLLVVTASVALAALVFAVVLQRSLATNSAEKAYVATGADAQGVVDVSAVLPPRVAKAVELFDTARLDDGRPVELLGVDPPRLRGVLRWRWEGDPDGALARLAASRARLPAIAVGTGGADVVWIDGRRERVEVVATLPAFPGMLAGEPLFVMPLARLQAVAPGAFDGATAYVWARGEGRAAARTLARSPVGATYVTTVDDFLRRADLSTASRTYSYLRLIAIGAAVVAFLALALYLHARARSQLVTAELLARMGLSRRRQAASVALEAAALVGYAAVIGGLAGVLSAYALVHTIDPLPQYAPAAFPVVPWAALVAGLVAATLAAAAAGAVSVLLARGDLAEAVRVV